MMGSRLLRRTVATMAMATALACLPARSANSDGGGATTGLLTGVEIDGGDRDYSNSLRSRLLTPLALEALRRGMPLPAGSTKSAFNLGSEKFTLYVPRTRPPSGYGLLVFIAPYPGASLPTGWASVLERRGALFITPAHAGNDEDIVGRRMPLALAAFDYATRQYTIDRTKTYIGGFSGG